MENKDLKITSNKNPRFKDKDAHALWKGEWVSKYQKIKKVGYKKLHSVINATSLNDLYLIPGNHTEELKGKKGYYSIKINDQYRVSLNEIKKVRIMPRKLKLIRMIKDMASKI